MQYEILKELEITDEKHPLFGSHAVGSIVEMDEKSAEGYVKNGIAKLVLTSGVAQPVHATNPNPAPQATNIAPPAPAVAGVHEPKPRYRGSVVIVDSLRNVGAQTFHHIRTEEGHEYDLTDAEYRAEVKVSYPPAK